MPPAAISRSSTYLPKICGNIATFHVSSAAFFWLLSGCTGAHAVDIALPVQLHALTSCPVPNPARIDLFALGDFPITNNSRESLALSAEHAKLAFPVQTLALEASASSNSSDLTYIGYSERLDDRLDFLVWPQGSVCELLAGGTYPSRFGGEASGYANGSGVVLFAGNDESSSGTVVGALTFDVRTGDSRVLDPLSGLREPRAYATVTEYGTKLLVAGGEDPIHDAAHEASVLRDSAEVYDPDSHSFEPDSVKLVEGTTHHAATTLLSGETVLIGGRNAASEASAFIQLVSPTSGASQLAGTLRVGRSNATVLRLSDGRLFVAGGEDAAGQPVGELEWRGPDAGALGPPFDATVSLPARYDRAFTALPGGAVLAVGGCEARAAVAGEDCAAWCHRGCPPSDAAEGVPAYDAFWIGADGSVSRLDFPLSAGHPRLLPGSDGRPWLISSDTGAAGDPLAGSRALYRFDPWRQRFSRSALSLPGPVAGDDAHFVATGSDAFVWLDSEDTGPLLRGMRLGTRATFASDVALVGLRDPEDITRPAHLAPDRPPGSELRYDRGTGALLFARVSGPTPLCVWITDAEYADFTATVVFSGAVAPSLRVGLASLAELAEDPSAPCVLPGHESNPSDGTISLERKSARLTARIGAAATECETSPLRVAFAVCGSRLAATQVTSISVIRVSK